MTGTFRKRRNVIHVSCHRFCLPHRLTRLFWSEMRGLGRAARWTHKVPGNERRAARQASSGYPLFYVYRQPSMHCSLHCWLTLWAYTSYGDHLNTPSSPPEGTPLGNAFVSTTCLGTPDGTPCGNAPVGTPHLYYFAQRNQNEIVGCMLGSASTARHGTAWQGCQGCQGRARRRGRRNGNLQYLTLSQPRRRVARRTRSSRPAAVFGACLPAGTANGGCFVFPIHRGAFLLAACDEHLRLLTLFPCVWPFRFGRDPRDPSEDRPGKGGCSLDPAAAARRYAALRGPQDVGSQPAQ